MGDRHPLHEMLRAGACIGLDLREQFGVVMFLPTTQPERAAERGPGRLGTLPSKPRPKPVHGGYPGAGEYSSTEPPIKKRTPFSIVRN